MSHTYHQLMAHVVFSTKGRRKLIPKENQSRTWTYMARICESENFHALEIGGMDDHCHALIRIPANMTLADAVKNLKAKSSKWLGTNFEWQRGYAAFSVSQSNVNAVVKYIRNQESHHKKMTFEEEFIAFLEKHGIPYDPKYVFD
ncbi:MAG TPA: IS200/IS605 family transposase [Candidatus Limnocylindrales bacterium]|nr:IS200/IS605 family transposase [Candidatus Limnocylindrales bacterium]